MLKFRDISLGILLWVTSLPVLAQLPLRLPENSEGEALLKTSLIKADEDSVRLIFADWLEGEGAKAWAGFTRLQIEISRNQKSTVAQRAVLRRLFLEAKEETTGEFAFIPDRFRSMPIDIENFERGLLANIVFAEGRSRFPKWLLDGDSLIAGVIFECPSPTSHVERDLDELLKSTLAKKIKKLEVRSYYPAQVAMAELVKLPALKSVRFLYDPSAGEPVFLTNFREFFRSSNLSLNSLELLNVPFIDRLFFEAGSPLVGLEKIAKTHFYFNLNPYDSLKTFGRRLQSFVLPEKFGEIFLKTSLLPANSGDMEAVTTSMKDFVSRHPERVKDLELMISWSDKPGGEVISLVEGAVTRGPAPVCLLL